MNKEIKEMLEDIKPLAKRQYNELKDYITNLQKDNEKIGELWREEEAHCILLQQENERLKEENNNKAMNDYAHAIDESWYRELYDDYKSRCEKAIEYIKNNKEKQYGYNYEYGLTDKNIDDLLNILQGSDK